MNKRIKFTGLILSVMANVLTLKTSITLSLWAYKGGENIFDGVIDGVILFFIIQGIPLIVLTGFILTLSKEKERNKKVLSLSHES